MTSLHPAQIDDNALLDRARQVLAIEADAVQHLRETLDESFCRACRQVLACQGRVIVSGMGKSGHIARKIAATLASTGTPAFFVILFTRSTSMFEVCKFVITPSASVGF